MSYDRLNGQGMSTLLNQLASNVIKKNEQGTQGQVLGFIGNNQVGAMSLSGSTDWSLVANVELTTTASRAYLVDDYLVYNGVLYKVIANISQGDTLTVNTNIQSTTVGNELQASGSSVVISNAEWSDIEDVMEEEYGIQHS